MLGLSQDGEAAAFALAAALDRQVEEPHQGQEQWPEQVRPLGDPIHLKGNKTSLTNRLLGKEQKEGNVKEKSFHVSH